MDMHMVGAMYAPADWLTLVGQSGALTGRRLAVELSLPLLRDLNGPQMETDWSITAGWQYAFQVEE